MVKTNLFLSIFFIIILKSCFYAQNIDRNTIIDSENGSLLLNVSITKIENDSIFASDDGYFTIKISGFYTFSKEGYTTRKVKLNSKKGYKIALQKTPSALNEIIINTHHLPIKLKSSTTSTALVSAKDIERGNSVNINEALNRVPGVFMQTGALNTNRITIRGVGARNLFGTSKIRAYIKDIPLTNGSGETSLEDFELSAISRIEITKGATSSVYGSGLGGVIQLMPKKAILNNYSISNETTIGSFGLLKNLSQLNYGGAKHNLKLVYSHTNSDGYRNNNHYKRSSLTLLSSHSFNTKNELSVFGAFSGLKAFIPSSLNETDFRNNPQKAAFTWSAAKGFEDTKRNIIGVSLQHKFHDRLKQTTSIFASFRNSYEPRPFNILEESVFGYGLRHRYIGNFNINDKAVNWTSGIELFKDQYKYQTFENLYQDFPEANGSIQGEALSNFKEKRYYYNLFFEGRYSMSSRTDIVLGINYNKTGYDLEDEFPTSASNPDQSGSFTFKGIFSPKFGLLYSLNTTSNIYANVSHGFSPLTLQETLLPNGQINNNLSPETGWNLELGLKGQAIKKRLEYNISIYRLSIKNLLVARRTAEDEFIGINAGKTQHDGLEANLNYNIINSEKIQLSIFGSCTLNQYKFRDFVDGTANFSGNDLTGVPSHVLNLGIDVNTTSGVYGNINVQNVGAMPITDSNSIYSDTYTISNFKIGYRKTLFPQLTVHTFLGINNIFDVSYASQILINASSFGGNAPRYFYPGNPLNYYAAMALNYSF
ncbi:TonB-dependent receptor family protein [Hyunsoonleella ulvae]|uniref:TonB-dependent receptor family protein n=1 Tax=Hyunsoonleella ulvae TaxID=2799948 RepID=UPI00193A794E|nr:TonB-dependent receptor [Hyunsoonleella ulvae]